MKESNYQRISYEDRVKIEGFLRIRMSITNIAKELNRPKSTISREVKRGLSFPSERYLAQYAQIDADIRLKVRRIDSKLKSQTRLRIYVLRRLIIGWSPEQISKRMELDYPRDMLMRVSYESIYKYIYYETKGKQQQRLIGMLPYSKPIRTRKSKRTIYMGSIRDRVSIDDRPELIELRNEVGHWEGDLIVGKGQQSAVGTLVERKTRYTIIVHLKSRKSEDVVSSFAARLTELPTNLKKTLTYDNGIEMAYHKRFTNRTGMPVYFAHPYSSWERGTNENTNGLIRRVFKKKTDFRKVTPEQLLALEKLLNNRPRKVLGFYTPTEMIQKQSA